jgi:hypothetical protein
MAKISETQTEHDGQFAVKLEGQRESVKDRINELFSEGYCIVPGSTVLNGHKSSVTVYSPDRKQGDKAA